MFDHVKGGALRSRGIDTLMASDGRGLEERAFEEGKRKGEMGWEKKEWAERAGWLCKSPLQTLCPAPTSDREPNRRECHLSERALFQQYIEVTAVFLAGLSSSTLGNLRARIMTIIRSGFEITCVGLIGLHK